MLDYATSQKLHPVVILLPGNGVTDRKTSSNFENNKYVVEQNGEKVAIIALGDFYQMGEELANEIRKQLGFTPTLINPRYASVVDKELLDSLKANHSVVITLEDGIKDGGFGQKIASYLGESGMKVKNYGLEKCFYDRYNPAELLEKLGMTPNQMLNDVKNLLK